MSQLVAKKVSDFFSSFEAKKYAPRQIIIYAGEEPKGVFFIEKGEVRQYDIADNGAEVVINTFKPKTFLPMSWAINKTPNVYFFETVNDTVLRLAPADEVVNFVKTNPDVCFDLLSRVFLGADGILKRLSYSMVGSAKTRLINELNIACQRFGEKQADGSYLLNFHEEQLATRVGLSRETVNRTLKELKSRGILSVSHKSIVVRDLDGLNQMLIEKD